MNSGFFFKFSSSSLYRLLFFAVIIDLVFFSCVFVGVLGFLWLILDGMCSSSKIYRKNHVLLCYSCVVVPCFVIFTYSTNFRWHSFGNSTFCMCCCVFVIVFLFWWWIDAYEFVFHSFKINHYRYVSIKITQFVQVKHSRNITILVDLEKNLCKLKRMFF